MEARRIQKFQRRSGTFTCALRPPCNFRAISAIPKRPILNQPVSTGSANRVCLLRSDFAPIPGRVYDLSTNESAIRPPNAPTACRSQPRLDLRTLRIGAERWEIGVTGIGQYKRLRAVSRLYFRNAPQFATDCLWFAEKWMGNSLPNDASPKGAISVYGRLESTSPSTGLLRLPLRKTPGPKRGSRENWPTCRFRPRGRPRYAR